MNEPISKEEYEKIILPIWNYPYMSASITMSYYILIW